jgi:hypothetical protein
MSLIIEGTSEKVSQIIMPQKSTYDINLCIDERNVLFELWRKVETYKKISQLQHVNMFFLPSQCRPL